MVTVEDLAKHLGFSEVPVDSESMTRALDSAIAIIDPHIVGTGFADHPTYELSVLTIAGDLWRRKDAPGGVFGFADGTDYSFLSMPRDPLPSVWSWLASSGLVNPTVTA